MTKQVQRRRGTATQHTSFTGAEGEISVNTTNKSAHVHDGVTAGGFELARKDLDNVTTSSVASKVSGGTISTIDINGGTIDNTVIGGSSAAAGTFTTVTASGDLTIADKIVHSGDTNTAIRFPAADTVTVETAGAERMRIDSSGRVGIGTSSPATALDVVGTVTADGLTVDGTVNIDGASGIPLTLDVDAGANTNLQFNEGSALRWYLRSVTVSNDFNFYGNGANRLNISSGGDISFYEDTGTTPKFFWDASAEALGIGTSSPSNRLTVNSGASTTTAQFTSTGSSVFLGLTNSGASAFIGADSTGAFAVQTPGSAYSTKMLVDSSGNVGIGVSGPSAKLDILGATSNQLRLRTASTEHYAIGRNSSTGFLDFSGTQSGYIGYTFGGADGERMRIDASGNLGLGVTPSAWGGNYRAFQVGYGGNINAGNGTYPTYVALGANHYVDSTPTARYLYTAAASLYQQNGGEHQWLNAPSGTAGNAITFTQAMTLDASGNLALGTTSPAEKLHVSGNVRASNFLSGGASVAFGTSTSDIRYVQLSSDFHIWYGASGTERARIDDSGNLLVGTTSASCGGTTMRQHVSATDFCLGLTTAASGNTQALRFAYGTTAVGSVTLTGSTTSYNTSSDYRLKENVAPMQNALATVAQLNPVTYTWKADGSAGQGFIAHELQAVVPDCVTGEKDAVDAEGNPQYQGVDTSFLVATLVKAIQELKAEVDSLRAQLNP